MNRGGRWIMIATLAGDISPVNLRMLYARCVRLIGTTLRSRTSEYKAAMLAEMVEKVWPMVADGRLRPTICKVFPIEQAEEAQAFMRGGHYAGKIVLTVQEG